MDDFEINEEVESRIDDRDENHEAVDEENHVDVRVEKYWY